MSRPYLLPPETAADRVAALRLAFEALMIDAQFLEEMEKLQLEVKLTKGTDIVDLMKRLYSFPAATVNKMREAIATGGR